MEWKNVFRGFIMGISDLIPGVSGGTLAVILGIYDRLLESISGVFSRDFKSYLGFLVPLGIGILSAIFLLSRLIDYLLEFYYEPTQFFFIGLIFGVLPFLIRKADVRRSFQLQHYIVLLLATTLVASMAFFTPESSIEPITSLSVLTVVGLFFSGWLASMSMLLPGISGSFVLLLLGVYSTAINALSTFNLPVIAVIGAGVIVGFILSSKGIRYLLDHYHHVTYAAIIGLIIGSVFVVYPGAVDGLSYILLCLATFGLGFTVAVVLGKK